MLKYVQIAELLKRRIESGDYKFCAIPGVPKLAAETGVSYLTARQAVGKLIADGVLYRMENGRLAVKPPHGIKALNVVFVLPLYCSNNSVWWRNISRLAREYGCVYREIVYSHDDDPILFEALDGSFDLIFLMANQCSQLFYNKIKKNRDKIVMLFHDLSDCGVRCLDGLPPGMVRELIAMLRQRGHRKIDCYAVEPETASVSRRIEAWRQGLAEFDCPGELHYFPVKNFEPVLGASYRRLGEVIAARRFDADALFCISVETARGALRALYDHGIEVPRDLSLVTFGTPEEAAMTIPSLTTIDTPDPSPAIRAVFEHYLGIRPVPDQLMFRITSDRPIREGESVAPRP